MARPAVGGSYLAISVAILLVWVLALEVHRTREETVLGIGSEEYERVMDATLGVFGGIAILVLLLGIDVVRSHFALALPGGALLLLINRWQWRAWLNWQRHYGRHLRQGGGAWVAFGQDPDAPCRADAGPPVEFRRVRVRPAAATAAARGSCTDVG
ncbi:hypothetical protein [Pseudarthrobacter albicanus]|uniref:hypothetical protein n=1 Tax=Pseudarthrobacter albicanus TaxID=2823873 RepID=UPI001BADE487|nr:hypothetical protein [Pseudarthrobacter albicanus]